MRESPGLVPLASGVYVFMNVEGPVRRQLGRTLYVGKATNLRSRLASYLASPEKVRIRSRKGGPGSPSSSLRHVRKALNLMKVAPSAGTAAYARTRACG